MKRALTSGSVIRVPDFPRPHVDHVVGRKVARSSGWVDAYNIVDFARAKKRGHTLGGDVELGAVGTMPVDKVLQVGLLDERQNSCSHRPLPTDRCCNTRDHTIARRKPFVRAKIVVHRKPNLFEVVFALSSPAGLASLLNGWKQQSDQDRDDRNHHQ